jgi:hypothetical protein
VARHGHDQNAGMASRVLNCGCAVVILGLVCLLVRGHVLSFSVMRSVLVEISALTSFTLTFEL